MKRMLLSLAAFVGMSVPAAALEVTQCGQTVPAGETGVVQVDLDCPNDAFGVRLLPRATLDLNGHTIKGGGLTFATVVGVGSADGATPFGGDPEGSAVGSPRGDFTIVGPGRIEGQPPLPHTTQGGTFACVHVNDGRARLTSATASIEITGCVYGVLGSSDEGPGGKARVEMDHVDLHDLGFDGAVACRMVASDVTAHDNPGGQGLVADKTLTVTNVVANNNAGHGLFAVKRLTGYGVTAIANITGVESWGRVALTNLVATNNQYYGAAARSLRLTDSTLTGNGLGDLVSGTRPLLTDTVCGMSVRVEDGSVVGNWGVCAND